MASSGYDPARCDLCGSDSYRIILDIPGFSMTSDDQVVEHDLKKIECANCKLVRSGLPVSTEQLKTHYETNYQLGQKAAMAEPLYYLENGVLPRSKVIFDWILSGLSQIGSSPPSSVLEIGCGEGSLLQHFASYWRTCRCRGLDISEKSVEKARARGLEVSRGSYRDVKGMYDLIYSFAVIEHVPSPSDFIATLKSHLTPKGALLISQPSQDYGSNDIFFSDHLWHFYSHHIAELAARQHFQESLRLTGSKTIPNFSLHIFHEAVSPGKTQQFSPPIQTIDQTISMWRRIFEGIDAWLSNGIGRRLVVWGIGQTFTLFSAYTALKEHQISFAIEDNPQRFDRESYNFPVIRFDPRTFENDQSLRVLFTFRPSKPQVRQFKEMSISYYSPFEEEI